MSARWTQGPRARGSTADDVQTDRLDRDRAASMADEGGSAAAQSEAEDDGQDR